MKCLPTPVRGAVLFSSARQHVQDIFVNSVGTFFDDASNHRIKGEGKYC
jgi:hypothetical protein